MRQSARPGPPGVRRRAGIVTTLNGDDLRRDPLEVRKATLASFTSAFLQSCQTNAATVIPPALDGRIDKRLANELFGRAESRSICLSVKGRASCR
jgi:hypothetical protein